MCGGGRHTVVQQEDPARSKLPFDDRAVAVEVESQEVTRRRRPPDHFETSGSGAGVGPKVLSAERGTKEVDRPTDDLFESLPAAAELPPQPSHRSLGQVAMGAAVQSDLMPTGDHLTDDVGG